MGRVRPAKPDRGRGEVALGPRAAPRGRLLAGADIRLRMPGEEEERAFLAARKQLASALRTDSGQAFSLEQLLPLLNTSLPPAARYLLLDAARLIRCNARGEVRRGQARKGGLPQGLRLAATSQLGSLSIAHSPETTSAPCPRP